MADPKKRLTDEEFEALIQNAKAARSKAAAEKSGLLKPLEPVKAGQVELKQPGSLPQVYPTPPAGPHLRGPNLDRDAAKIAELKAPITTAARPSAPGRIAEQTMESGKTLMERIPDEYKPDANFFQNVQLEARKPLSERTGVSGVASALMPEIKAEADEMGMTRKVVEENLPYIFKLLNVPSALIAASIETGFEKLAGTGEQPTASQEFLSNLARTIGQGEGIAEAYEKGAKKAEDLVEDVTGVRPEYKPLGDNWGPDIGIDPSNMAWWQGLGADFLVPSTPEVVSGGLKGVSKIPTPQLPNLGRTPPPRGSKSVDVSGLEVSLNPPGVVSELSMSGLKTNPEYASVATVENGVELKPEQVKKLMGVHKVSQVIQFPKPGEPGVLWKDVDGEPKMMAVVARSTSEQRKAQELLKKAQETEARLRAEAARIDEELKAARSQPEEPAREGAPATEPVDARLSRLAQEQVKKQAELSAAVKQSEQAKRAVQDAKGLPVSQMREALGNSVVPATLRDRIRFRKQLQEELDDYLVDARGLGRLPSEPPSGGGFGDDPGKAAREKTVQVSTQDYIRRLSSIPDRWKHFGRKEEYDEAFDELFPQDIKRRHEEISRVVARTFIDSYLDKVEAAGKLNQGSRISDPSARSLAEKKITERLEQVAKKALADMTPDDGLFDAIKRIYNRITDPTDAANQELLGRYGEFPAFNRMIGDIYYRVSTEAAAREQLQFLSERGIGELLTPEEIKELKLRPETLSQILSSPSGLDKNLPDLGYKRFLEAVYERIDPALKERDSSQMELFAGSAFNPFNPDASMFPYASFDKFYEHMLKNEVGFKMLEAVEQEIGKLDLINLVSVMGAQRYQDRLANALLRDPAMSRVFSDAPDKIRVERGKYLIDTLYKAAVGSDPRQQDLALRMIRQLSDVVQGWQGISKTSTLGGLFLPNAAYHFVNAATAPLIIYQQLGLLPALGSLANVGEASKLIRRIYSENKIPLSGSLKVLSGPDAGKEYLYEDLIRFFQENNLANSQARIELPEDFIDEMSRYYDTTRIERRSPFKAKAAENSGTGRELLEFNPQGIKNFMGLQGPNVWNEAASAFDQTWRMSVMMDAIRSGDSPVLAARKAREALFDYGNLSEIEKQSFAKYIWFYSFWRHNLTSTLQMMTTPRGWTRIKNGLMPFGKADRAQAEDEYSLSKPYFGRSINGRYDLYGPGIPQAEAVNQVANLFSNLYFLMPKLSSPTGMGQISVRNTADFMAQKAGSNKLWNLLGKVFFEYDLSQRRPTSPYLPDNHAQLLRATELLVGDPFIPRGMAADLYDLTWDERRKQYKFGSRAGQNAYLMTMNAIFDSLAGRTTRDVGKMFLSPTNPRDPNNYEQLSGSAKVGDFIGIQDPVRRKSLDKVIGDANKNINR